MAGPVGDKSGRVRLDRTGGLRLRRESTSIGGESVFFLTLCWGRRDGVQELRNCGALVGVRVAVLDIDHVDGRWQVRGRMRLAGTWTRFEER